MTKTLGHTARLRILAMLRHHRLSVCQIAAVLQVAPSTASGYLVELRHAGLVVEHREGKWVFYQLAQDDETDALLRFVLLLVATDDQVREDSAAARALAAASPALACGSAEDCTPVAAPASVGKQP